MEMITIQHMATLVAKQQQVSSTLWRIGYCTVSGILGCYAAVQLHAGSALSFYTL